MPADLHGLIDPFTCVDQHRDYEGVLDRQALPRMHDLGLLEPSRVHAALNFFREGRFPVVKVRIQADLVLECVACLEPLDWHTDYTVKLVIVETEDEIDFLPEDYEPWLLEDDKVSIAQLVEDELILLIPQVPRHEVCNKHLRTQASVIPSETTVEKRKNPFDALKALKNTDSSGD